MPFIDTKTQRQVVVSMMLGPEGKLLSGPEYVAWLDRRGWEGGHEAVAESDTLTNAECTVCGKAFAAARSTAKYCSERCKSRFLRDRRAKEEMTRINTG